MLYPNKWRERVHLDNMEAWCRICITLIPHIAEARDAVKTRYRSLAGVEHGSDIAPCEVALPNAAVEITQCSHRKRRRDKWSVWKVCTSELKE